ncbi:hypothetical protein EV174_001205 [Coemansia sp. RSA 2320]|nr:hypothetical protein EV174_001205 [Coemansia sp. RSA 2320]
MVERTHRDSTVLPTMKCAQCNQDVHIRLIGQHDCTAQPAVPSLPPALMARGLSSFFLPPQPPSAQQQLESGAYKPSLRLLAEDSVEEFDFDDMLQNATSFTMPASGEGRSQGALPMFSNNNSSASVDSFAAGLLSPLEMSRTLGGPAITVPQGMSRALGGLSQITRHDGPRSLGSRSQAVQETSRTLGSLPQSTQEDGPRALGVLPQTKQNDKPRTPDGPIRTAPVGPPAPACPAPSLLARLERARAELAQNKAMERSDSFMTESPSSESSFGLSPEPSGRAGGASHTNSGHKKTGSIAITAFPPVSPQDSSGARTSGRRRDGGNEAAIVPQQAAAAATDPQIRISARKAAVGAAGTSASARSASPQLSTLVSTAQASTPMTKQKQSPLDVLASLVPQAMPPPQTGSLPRIDTQVGARAIGIRRAPAAAAATATTTPSAGAGKSLKSAKLDSLLDDLMGQMQALSAEVRTESDRESMVSTASNSASPSEAAAPAHRTRFDSSVSSASSCSTLSGSAHQRRACATCGTSIAALKGAVARSSALRGDVPAGVSAVEHQGRVYCVRDYKKAFGALCAACTEPCETTARASVFALDAWWHRACFNCQECRQPFPDKSFYVLDHRPYCRYDYHKLNHSLCVACCDPIEGPCAQVLEGRFHPACFACAHCGDALRDVYYSLDGRFLCERHVHQSSTRPADKRKTVYGHV